MRILLDESLPRRLRDVFVGDNASIQPDVVPAKARAHSRSPQWRRVKTLDSRLRGNDGVIATQSGNPAILHKVGGEPDRSGLLKAKSFC